jgi:hypothetical protein
MYHVAYLNDDATGVYQTAASNLDGTGFSGWTVQTNPGQSVRDGSASASITTDGKNLYYTAFAHDRGDESFALTSSTVTSHTLISKLDAYELIQTGGGFVFDWAGAPKSFGTSSAGTFTHVAITQDGSTMAYYVDGALARTQTVSADFSLTGNTLNIGGEATYFDGIIDEVRISGNARSADWMAASYKSQNGTFVFNNFGSEESPAGVATTDKAAPVVLSAAMSDSTLKVGETSTLTVTFSEAVTSFDNSDITTLENGTLDTLSTADGGVTWTSTFTPTDNIEDMTNVITVGTALTDLVGNAPVAGNITANYTIDTTEPVVSSVVMSDSALKAGETSTLTITFSEAVTGFDNTDITLENGTLTAVSSGDGGVTWTGTFTPTDNIEDTTNVITVGTALTDLAGNTPLAGNTTANYTIDTTEPVVSSVVMSDSALKVGETSTLTITFSEAVTAFDNTDITLENGTLTAVSSADGGITWTGTLLQQIILKISPM